MMNPHKRYAYSLVIALLAGALLPLAFAPHALWPLAALSLIPLCLLWQRAHSAAQCFWYGFLYTFAAFLMGASWVYISIHVFGQASGFVASLITCLFIVFLALQAGCIAWLWRRVCSKQHYWSHCWLLPAAWVLIEWCREWLFTGFPWLSIGNLATTPWLSGWLPLLGVTGTSFLLLCLCCHVAYAIHNRRLLTACLAAGLCLITFGVAYPLKTHDWTQAHPPSLQLALVQGNVPVSMKWDPKQNAMAIDHYLAATKHHLDADVIVWPETAIPTFDTAAPHFLTALSQLMTDNHSALITGISHADTATHRAYNSMMVLGDGRGRYDKIHLVPFGEYFPVPSLLGWIYHAIGLPMSSYSAGDPNQPPLVVKHSLVAPAICYEIAYPALIQARAKQANWLLVISDDAWFGRSAASAQQLQMAQARALENGRPVVYATNNGITALINAHGQITQRLPVNQYRVLKGKILPRKGLTPEQQLPPYLWRCLCLALLLGSAIAYRLKRSQ